MSQLSGNRERTRDGAKGISPSEFAVAFQSAYRLLWVVASGVLNDSSSAEDVVQEAALLALGKLGDFEPGTNFTAWMAQMVRFVALNHGRKRQKRRAAPLDGADADLQSPGGDPANGSELHLLSSGELPADQGHFDDQVVSALNAVSDIARACLLLRTVENLEYSEISRVLDIPQGTAMSHVHRTRQYLRQRLASLEATLVPRKAKPS